jgi:hypothetical protein
VEMPEGMKRDELALRILIAAETGQIPRGAPRGGNPGCNRVMIRCQWWGVRPVLYLDDTRPMRTIGSPVIGERAAGSLDTVCRRPVHQPPVGSIPVRLRYGISMPRIRMRSARVNAGAGS